MSFQKWAKLFNCFTNLQEPSKFKVGALCVCEIVRVIKRGKGGCLRLIKGEKGAKNIYTK